LTNTIPNGNDFVVMLLKATEQNLTNV